MKKLISIILLFSIFLLPQFSCNKLHYLISDINFSGATLSKKGDEPYWNIYKQTNVFTKDLVFVISHQVELVTAVIDLNFISSCYAFKKGSILDNGLLKNTFSISFDKQFIYKGETIEAGTNLFKVESIKENIRIFESYMAFNNGGADAVIEFSDDFIKNTEFNRDKYIVKFECETSNNLKFSKSIEAEFKFE